MPNHDPRVDAYIERAPEYARPILGHFREVIHAACPEMTEEIKWGAPAFMHHGIVCSMVAFKQHCALWVRKQALLARAQEAQAEGLRTISSLRELPADEELAALIRAAADLNERGVKLPSSTVDAAALKPPADLAEALDARPGAAHAFEAMSPSQRKDYVEWIVEAKRPETRRRRIETAVEWISEGKPRNWKYIR